MADLVDAAGEVVAAPAVFFHHGAHRPLVARQGFDGRLLRDRAGIGGRVFLDLGHGRSQRLGGDGVAKAPAGHGVGLGKRADHGHVLAGAWHKVQRRWVFALSVYMILR